MSLPRKTRFLFILCAATFVSGAIGVEMIGGQIASLQGVGNLSFKLATTVEETLEMVAIAGFIYTLLDYLKNMSSQQLYVCKQDYANIGCHLTSNILYK